MRSFGLVDDKVKEAEFFLDRLCRCKDFFAARCYSVAFASATRSITFALQASLNDLDGFDKWYAKKQIFLKKNRLARFFHEFRRVSQHLGANLVGGGSSKKGKPVFLFVPHPELADVPDTDVVTASRRYYIMLLKIVFECYIVFGPHIDAHQHYTEEHYASLGKTIEDAEERLGYPRGWTDSGNDTDLAWRWEALRNSVSGCGLQESFYKYLRKRVPVPKVEYSDGFNITVYF